MYQTLEVLGPEHEFSIVDESLKPLPIVDRVIKELRGRIVNNISFSGFTFGKELQSHVAEIKANNPFESPCIFEEAMYGAVLKIDEMLERKFSANFLGLGMHPFLELDEAKIWQHRDRSIYEAMGRIFNLRQHGWLNIQSFQLNLPYSTEADAIKLHNTLSNILPYLPAISAASPIYESKMGTYVDNRLQFYMVNQREVPSVTGDVIPEYIASFDEYNKITVEKYSSDLKHLHADPCIIGKEWLNSRGAIFRFDRKAIEIRIMDEQECIKSDVALSCFVRALLRGLLEEDSYMPHGLLVEDFKSVIKDGLEAKVLHSGASKARDVCLHFFDIASRNASEDEKKYLPLVKRRIMEGNLSNLIIKDITKRSQKTSLIEAICEVYSALVENLRTNKPYL
jgi:gamma-glutamyl:cysteine ligase YbdK (ATP-grasp superfamily)